MNTSNPHQLSQQTTADATDELWTRREERPAQQHERPKRVGRNYVRSRRIRAAAQEVRTLINSSAQAKALTHTASYAPMSGPAANVGDAYRRGYSP